MTNPSNAVGTNGAYGGRTSVDALNDVLGAFSGAGVLSGWNVRANSGMTVMAGGQSGIRDVAIAQDQLGDRTTVNNRLGSPVNITLSASSPSAARVDSIVLYVNKPASVSTTTIDNPGACGIIAVNGTTTAPSEADIRSAITADGGTGATAYFVVIADITIPASATVITNSNITNYSGKLLGSGMIADGAITSDKIDWTTTGIDSAPVKASNFITMNSGYSAVYDNVYTLGRLVILDLVIKGSSAFPNGSQVAVGTLASAFRPAYNNINAYVGIGGEWNCPYTGYCYISAGTGVISIRADAANQSFARLYLVYVKA